MFEIVGILFIAITIFLLTLKKLVTRVAIHSFIEQAIKDHDEHKQSHPVFYDSHQDRIAIEQRVLRTLHEKGLKAPKKLKVHVHNHVKLPHADDRVFSGKKFVR